MVKFIGFMGGHKLCIISFACLVLWCYTKGTAQNEIWIAMTETISVDITNEFTRLYNQWQIWLMQPDLRFSSKTQDYIECQPYKDIVKLGKAVVPLIIRKLEEGRATGWNNAQFFLWHAVRDITAIDLSKKKPYATEQEIAELYIDWWETRHRSQ